MVCPLCGQRKARRTCPALGHQICTVCCGTKRLVEIACPADCVYLTTAREHPPAAAVRRQQRDAGVIVHAMRDLSGRQSDLFFMLVRFLSQYDPTGLHPAIDDDVADATGAMASTYETAARGVIYEHRPTSLPAERLAGALKPLLTELGGQGGSAFDRDAAVVLRRLEQAARHAREGDPDNRRAFLELLARVLKKPDETDAAGSASGEQPPSRLIVP